MVMRHGFHRGRCAKVQRQFYKEYNALLGSQMATRLRINQILKTNLLIVNYEKAKTEIARLKEMLNG